jgi:hypothetical protein
MGRKALHKSYWQGMETIVLLNRNWFMIGELAWKFTRIYIYVRPKDE